MATWSDFDRYVQEHGIPEENYPAAFALWYAETTGEPVPRFERVERETPDLVIEATTSDPRPRPGARRSL